MNEIELRVDRIEEGLAVAYDDSGHEYTFPAERGGVAEGDILLAALDGSGSVAAVKRMQEKTDAVKREMQTRLNRLFDKRGN